jgi:hypothetical protein
MKTRSTSAKREKKPKARMRDMNPKKDAKAGASNGNLLIATTYGRGSVSGT